MSEREKRNMRVLLKEALETYKRIPTEIRKKAKQLLKTLPPREWESK